MVRVALVVVVVAAAGCSLGGDDGDDDACAREPVEADSDGAHYGYVVDQLDLPSDSAEVSALGLDLDYWTGEGRLDNQLGSVIALFSSFGYDVDAEAQAMVDAGVLLHLLDLQTTSLNQSNAVGMRIGLGIDLDADPTDNFSGSEELGYDPQRGSGYATGMIVGNQLDLRIGSARIGVAFPGQTQPFVLPLIETRVVATVTEGAITGRIAGGIPAEFIDTALIPVLFEGVERVIARDCPDGVCEPDSSGDLILWALDENQDGTLTYVEFRDSEIVGGLLYPDVDLRREDGTPHDACAIGGDAGDALSVGIGFHAVRAQLR